ncbi:MAG: metalloregulator ArsR/SmtB family transcription factor [Smithella sp.]
MRKEANLFKVLSDVTRLRLALLLFVNGETCVCKLAEALNEPQCKISRHLGIMRSAGLVRTRREGTWIHYNLANPRSFFERSMQEILLKSLSDHPRSKKDLNRLLHASCS